MAGGPEENGLGAFFRRALRKSGAETEEMGKWKLGREIQTTYNRLENNLGNVYFLELHDGQYLKGKEIEAINIVEFTKILAETLICQSIAKDQMYVEDDSLKVSRQLDLLPRIACQLYARMDIGEFQHDPVFSKFWELAIDMAALKTTVRTNSELEAIRSKYPPNAPLLQSLPPSAA